MSDLMDLLSHDYYEASARDRILGVLDAGSFREFLGPENRTISPHLAQFGLTGAFDDGMVIGEGLLGGKRVYIAAQEGRFMGGAFGEVHGAKLVGLLRARRTTTPRRASPPSSSCSTPAGPPSGGERRRARHRRDAARDRRGAPRRRSGPRPRRRPVRRVRRGGIVTAFCSRIIVSEHGRIGVSGPEVIETNKGVEEFDSKDKGLVWRVTGGRTRAMMGGADRFVRDRIAEFRAARSRRSPAAAPSTSRPCGPSRPGSRRASPPTGPAATPEIWRKAGVASPRPSQP